MVKLKINYSTSITDFIITPAISARAEFLVLQITFTDKYIYLSVNVCSFEQGTSLFLCKLAEYLVLEMCPFNS